MQKRTLLLIVSLVLFAGTTGPKAYAALAGNELQPVLESVVSGVYGLIAADKSAHEVLKNFTPDCMGKNEYGMPRMEYIYKLSDKLQFVLYLNIIPFDGVDPAASVPGFNQMRFPVAGVKVGAYVIGRVGLGRFDYIKMVRMESYRIEQFEQRNLPLRLSLDLGSMAAPYHIKYGQSIDFDLVLKNVGSEIRRVKTVNEKSVYCSFNGQPWGQPEPVGPETAMLEPGEVLRRKMKITPKNRCDYEIYCSYGVGVIGQRPTVRALVRVE